MSLDNLNFTSEILNGKSPKEAGYFFPAEWHTHKATWLSWPHKEASWPGKLESIYDNYIAFIKAVAKGETVNINVVDVAMQQKVFSLLEKANVDFNKVKLHIHPTNDAWCRDHGPAFLINPESKKKIIVE